MPYYAVIWLSSSILSPSTYGTHRDLFGDSPQPLSLSCHPSKLIPSTWSAVNRCLFLLMISPAFEKACSDVDLMLAHTIDASPDPQFQGPRPHAYSTKLARSLNYGPPVSLLHRFAPSANCEELFHARPPLNSTNTTCTKTSQWQGFS